MAPDLQLTASSGTLWYISTTNSDKRCLLFLHLLLTTSRNTPTLIFWGYYSSSPKSPNLLCQIQFPPVICHVRSGSRQLFLILWGQPKIEGLQGKLFQSKYQLHRLADQASEVWTLGLLVNSSFARYQCFWQKYIFYMLKEEEKIISISQPASWGQFARYNPMTCQKSMGVPLGTVMSRHVGFADLVPLV